MRALVLAVMALLALSTSVAQSTGDDNQTYEECDFDGDGRISEEEKAYCDERYSTHACDADNGGTVNATEQDHCDAEYREYCDFDGDGMVSDEERRTCEEQYRNSTTSEHHEERSYDCDAYYDEYNHSHSDDEAYKEYRSYEEYQEQRDNGSYQYSSACDEAGDEHSDEHGYKYPEGHPAGQCDFNDDGTITRDEWDTDRCETALRDHYEDKARHYREQAITQAKEDGHVSAALAIRNTVLQDIETDDGVKVRIQHDVATSLPRIVSSAAVKVTFDADLDEGRTFVLDIDPELLGDEVTVRYFTVDPQTGQETEGVIREASDLEDILDPNDDDGQSEYWIVVDGNGLHVMVSIASWSVHSVSLQADTSEAFQTPGVGPVAMVSLLVAAVLLLRRRA